MSDNIKKAMDAMEAHEWSAETRLCSCGQYYEATLRGHVLYERHRMDEALKAGQREITDTDLNRMAQYFYEATHLYYGINVTSMTSKGDIVSCLKSALTRAGFIPQPTGWTIAYLHVDCERCEACAELAIDAAKATGEQGGSWQELVPGLDGLAAVGHRAVVERAS